MPFEYEVDTERGIAKVVGRGIVEVPDTLEAARNAARDAKSGVAPLLLVDLSDIDEFHWQPETIADITRVDETMAPDVDRRIAIVAPTRTASVIAEAFQLLESVSQVGDLVTVRRFMDGALAEAWLLETKPTTDAG